MSNSHFRPAYHYTPRQNWMSDPNGMVYSNGQFHLCYQHDRYDAVFQHMSWGHAVSADLLDWQEKAAVVVPDEQLGMCFSGCIVVDKDNTAGFGRNSLVGFYTSELPKQQQSMVYSTDGGENFQKYGNNPVIASTDEMSADFRDPKVFWFDERACWVMSVAGPERIEFWTSRNLIDWDFESAFGDGHGVHGCEWECPDLRCMPVDDDAENQRWMLIVSVNPGAPNGGSGTMYFVGDFVDQQGRLTFLSELTEPRWIDYGADNYAGVAWSNLEDSAFGRAVLAIGWMNNWRYAMQVPTAPWRGVMTLIRELKLRTFGDRTLLVSKPASVYERLHGASMIAGSVQLDRSLEFGPRLAVSRLVLSVTPRDLCDTGIKLFNAAGEETRVGYIPGRGFYVDRTRSGLDVHEDFAAQHFAPASAEYAHFNLEIYLDQCSIEVFINDGEFVLTELLFPGEPFTTLTAYPEGSADICLLEAHDMLPIEVVADSNSALQVDCRGSAGLLSVSG